MTLRKRIYLAILFVTVAGLVTFGGYKGGYSWGLYMGYTDGYNAGFNSFPRLDIDKVILTEGDTTIELRDMTITGEQHIIDFIKNLPKLRGIVNTSKEEW